MIEAAKTEAAIEAVVQKAAKKTKRKSRGSPKKKNPENSENPENPVKPENPNSPKKQQPKNEMFESRRRLKSLNDVNKEISLEELKESHPDTWQKFVQKTGRVVSILERKHTRRSVGYLKIFPDKNPNFALFSPTDSRVPRMKIPRANCPPEFWIRPQV